MTCREDRNGTDEAALDDADYKALADFRGAMREFLAFSAQGALAHGLTSQQHQALLAIKTHRGEEAISVGELADCLLIKNHSAVGMVARLVDNGFVRRLESSIDRRRTLVELTPEGAEALHAISIRNLGQLQRAAQILQGVVKTARKLNGRSDDRRS